MNVQIHHDEIITACKLLHPRLHYTITNIVTKTFHLRLYRKRFRMLHSKYSAILPIFSHKSCTPAGTLVVGVLISFT